jgi:DNA-binding NarL/FixJ family response regulator
LNVQPLFLSVDARQRETWREAFPDLRHGSIKDVPAGQGLVWVLQPGGRAAASVVNDLSRQLDGRALILLADEPSESEAMEALAAGASGYCNGHAAPEVLQQVAKVVENGGIWVGQGLMQRLLASTARLAPRAEADGAAWRALLTPREQDAAELLARGASNKEIARQLQITERTVKAHVGAMFEKLGVRDRLQLALIINGIDSPR